MSSDAASAPAHEGVHHLTVNVQNVLRLKLQNIGLRLPSGSMYAGWGDATIRCRTD